MQELYLHANEVQCIWHYQFSHLFYHRNLLSEKANAIFTHQPYLESLLKNGFFFQILKICPLRNMDNWGLSPVLPDAKSTGVAGKPRTPTGLLRGICGSC